MLEFISSSPLVNVSVTGEGAFSSSFPFLPLAICSNQPITYILTTDGIVYEGVFPTDHYNPVLYDVALLNSSAHHTLAVTATGKLYARGRNSCHQFGMSTLRTWVNTFVEVPFTHTSILQITACDHTSMLKGKDGNYYVAGSNTNGELHCTAIEVCEFTLLSLPPGEIDEVIMEDYTTTATMKGGEVYWRGAVIETTDNNDVYVTHAREWVLLD